MLHLSTLRAQLAVIAIAALSLVSLTTILVRDVIVGAEERLVAEAEHQCAKAAAELAQQYRERIEFRDEANLEALPPEAQDISLQALSATVLRAYEGLQGGFVMSGRVLGRAGGAELAPLTESELALLERLAASVSTVREHDGDDILVAARAELDSPSMAAWTLKRLRDAGSTAPSQRTWILGGLAISALLGFGALLSISLQLRRGVENLQHGLERLESDFAYRLPAVAGDLGAVAKAVNKMADSRDALEQQLRQRERLAALGRVVGGVAHEIRNPLNSMRLTLELLARRIRKQQGDAAQVGAAVAEVDRLDEILTKLLAFGRPGAENRELQRIRPIIERAARMAEERAARRGIQIHVAMDADEAKQARVDGSQIEQVLLNLMLNAVDASGDGDRVEVAMRNGAHILAIDVADHGSGVDPEARDKIFDPYFTTKDSGSGLGLAVSREIARRHGGDLSFSSETGRTVFTLSLPAPGEDGA